MGMRVEPLPCLGLALVCAWECALAFNDLCQVVLSTITYFPLGVIEKGL